MSDDADATRSAAPEVIAPGQAPTLRPELVAGDTFTDEPDRYEVERKIGAGGMGAVYAATSSRFGRSVALKLIALDRDDLRRRFEREAQVTARLQHPSIVPVYGSGAGRDGLPFYAMKQVSGEPLDKLIAKTAALAQRLALLPEVIAVAEAIAYAHTQRVIHRDLKPANILVGSFGETVIIDWGLAKDLTTGDDDPDTVSPYRAAGAHETAIGKVMGTPAYMPREQARGERVDERADVYALGAILHHVLAGRAPFSRDGEGSVPWETMLARVLTEPAPPLPEDVPADLVAIVTRAMAGSPGDRYPTARELADDLRKFQTGQLVGAHRYTTWELVKRWARRHRTPLYVGGIAAVALAALAIVSVNKVIDERDRADEQRAIAESERGEAQTQRATAVANEAEATRRADELTLLQARTLLDKDPTSSLAFEKLFGPTFTDWTHAWLVAVAARAQGVASRVVVRERDVGATVSPDGRYLATSSVDKEIWIVDLQTGARRTLVAGDTVIIMRFLPDGRTLVTSGLEKDIRLWNVTDGSVRKLSGHTARIDDLRQSPDGTRIVSTSADGTVRMWDVASGTAVQLAGKVDRAFTSSLRDDVFVAAALKHVQVWDLASPGTEPRAFDIPQAIKALTVTPDHKEIATTDRTGPSIRLTEIATGKVRELVPADARALYVTTVQFSPDGTRVAAGSADGKLWVWELASGRALGEIAAHTGGCSAVGFVDDTSVLTCGEDGTCVIWDVEAKVALARFVGHAGPIIQAQMTKDHRTLATSSRDHTARVWQVPTGRSWGLPDKASGVRFSPDGASVYVSGSGGVRRWSFADGAKSVVYEKEASSVRASHDGKLLAWGDEGKSVRVRDLATGETRELKGHGANVWGVEFSRDDKKLATSSMDKSVRVWDLATGESVELTGHTDIAGDVSFSPDGTQLVSVGFDKTVRIWDLATKKARVIKLETVMFNVKWSPDGKTIAMVGNDALVRLMNAASGEIRTLRGHSGLVYATSWSPDGSLLASSGGDGRVFVWDVASGTGEALRGHKSDVQDVTFSPDGRRLAAVSTANRTLLVWDLDAPRGEANLRSWLDHTTDAQVDRRGELK